MTYNSDQALTAPHLEPVLLRGSRVRLEPLTMDHLTPLAQVGLAPELWQWIPRPITTIDEMRTYVATALEEQTRGISLPFAIIDAGIGQVIGSTRFANIELPHRRLEIGWSWLAPSHQRTGCNTESKLLLLVHAFDVMGMHRVELKTDALNERSRAAILRLGAVQEGTFRRHLITSSGRVRDTVYFSIIDLEWPSVKARLESMCRQR